MLRTKTLTLGLYQTNTYLIWEENSKSCCVIDPGYDAKTIANTIARQGLTLEAILLTHGHFDHVGAVKELVMDTDCKVYLCAQDLAMPEAMTAGPLFYTHTYGEGDALQLAGLTIRVLQTPGHTPGSVCLLVENVLFSGDTLFAGSCGRTDFPGGSGADILKSLKRLAQMKNCTVYPSHGESTTLDAERMYNPYMQAREEAL